MSYLFYIEHKKSNRFPPSKFIELLLDTNSSSAVVNAANHHVQNLF